MQGFNRGLPNRVASLFCLGVIPIVAQQGVAAAKPTQAWLGFGVACGQCELTSHKGTAIWSFRRPPVVAEVSPGSPAAQAGLRVGDTLIALDGVSLVTEMGGVKLGRLEAGQRIRLAYRRGYEGSAMLVSAKQPESVETDEAGPVQFSGVVGRSEVEVRGDGARVLSDRNGVLEISVRGMTVRVKPAPGRK
jgi:hypothetical protein